MTSTCSQSAFDDRVGLVAEVGEVGRQDARRDHRLGRPDGGTRGVLTAQRLLSARQSAVAASAKNIASVPCRCGHSCTVGPAPRSGTPGEQRPGVDAASWPGDDLARSRPGAASRSRRRPRRPGGPGAAPPQQLALQRGQLGDVGRRAPPAGLGPAAQRPEPGARRVEQHPVVAAVAPAQRRGRRRPAPSTGQRRGRLRRPARRGAGAARWRSARRRARPASAASSAALPPGPGAQVEPALVAARRAARRPARARRAGCPRPAPPAAPAATAASSPGIAAGQAHRVRRPRARRSPPASATQLVAVEPARARRPDGSAAARRRRRAPRSVSASVAAERGGERLGDPVRVRVRSASRRSGSTRRR